MKTSQPTAEIAIDILTGLRQQVGPASLAYWVTPNTILTLSGVRAHCDGVFYHDDKHVLENWVKEMAGCIKALEPITDIYFAEAKISQTTTNENYAGYNVLMTQGLQYALEHTSLLGPEKHTLLGQNLSATELIDRICLLLKNNEQLTGLSQESLNHVAFGILVGYPDKAIQGSITKWEKDDPFSEPLINADIRGSWYYICPQPVYSYPRHLVADTEINAHEQQWSAILKDYYGSGFHKALEKSTDFQKKIAELDINR